MTYKELLNQLQQLNEEQLNQDVVPENRVANIVLSVN